MDCGANIFQGLFKKLAVLVLRRDIGRIMFHVAYLYLKSASNLNDNLNCSKELEHYAS